MKKILTSLCIFVMFLSVAASVDAASLTKTLRYGITNETEVYTLQEFLIEKGYLNGSPNGSIWRTTEEAIMKFQIANGLTPDGVVGYDTRRAINAQMGGYSASGPNFIGDYASPAIQDYSAQRFPQTCNGGSSECVPQYVVVRSMPGTNRYMLVGLRPIFDHVISYDISGEIVACNIQDCSFVSPLNL